MIFKILKKTLKTIIKVVFIFPLICLTSPDKYDIDKVQEQLKEFDNW